MYKYLALGIKSADSNLIVGGPAVDNNGDDQAFFMFVENNHVPINFHSNHDYGGSGLGALPIRQVWPVTMQPAMA